MNVHTVTRIQYTTGVSRLKNAATPSSTFVLPKQAPALVARNATVRTVAAKNMPARSRHADFRASAEVGTTFALTEI